MILPEIVWVVSFAIDEEGRFLDYAVHEFDLTRCSSTVSEHLHGLMGKGVFGNTDDAGRWAREQTQGAACCHKQTGERKCSCSKSKD